MATTKQKKKFMMLPCSTAVTKGYCVSIATNGLTCAPTLTATLNACVGVACNTTTTAGEMVKIQYYGYCDFIVPNEAIDAPGAAQAGDLFVYAQDTGTVSGATATEMDATSGTIMYRVVGRNLAASGTYGYVFLNVGRS